MALILGIDPSLTSTGFSGGGHRGCLSSKKTGVERLADFAEQITALVNLMPDRPAAVIEGYSFASRHSQAHALGELGGVIRLTLFRLGVPFVDVPPTCRAKFASGRGNASKQEVISALSARTGIIWSGKGASDEADGWILEEMGLCAIGKGRFAWPQQNLDALTKVDWSPLTELFTED